MELGLEQRKEGVGRQQKHRKRFQYGQVVMKILIDSHHALKSKLSCTNGQMPRCEIERADMCPWYARVCVLVCTTQTYCSYALCSTSKNTFHTSGGHRSEANQIWHSFSSARKETSLALTLCGLLRLQQRPSKQKAAVGEDFRIVHPFAAAIDLENRSCIDIAKGLESLETPYLPHHIAASPDLPLFPLAHPCPLHHFLLLCLPACL